MRDLISRQDAAEAVYNALRTPLPDYKKDPFHDSMSLAISIVKSIPSAEPEFTLENAIDYLRKIGWLQEHDRILTESAEPERKKGEWIKEESNPPLSFDELKQMENKPVWIKPDGMKGFWELIDVCNETEMIGRDVAGYADYFYRCNQGEQWEAYRKEKE